MQSRIRGTGYFVGFDLSHEVKNHAGWCQTLFRRQIRAHFCFAGILSDISNRALGQDVAPKAAAMARQVGAQG